MEKIIFKNLFMFLLRDLIKLPGKQGGTFLSHCVITSVKACWVFLTWWIYFSSRYAIHLHPLLKLGWFVFFTFRRGVGGLWQSWEVSFGCASHAGYQKLKTKMFFHYVVCFSVWESACMWLFFFGFAIVLGLSFHLNTVCSSDAAQSYLTSQ